jgi:hypothetical protein
MLQLRAVNGRREARTAIVDEDQIVNVQIRAEQVLVEIAPPQ